MQESDAEADVFRYAVEDACRAFADGSALLLVPSLAPEHRQKTVAAMTALTGFVLAFKGDFTAMHRRAPKEQATGEAEDSAAAKKGGGFKPNPIKQAFMALGTAFASIGGLLVIPNRLTVKQRELAYAVLEAVNDCILALGTLEPEVPKTRKEAAEA